jgi:ubiquitin carboxyl-terminal hydrolase 5/13
MKNHPVFLNVLVPHDKLNEVKEENKITKLAIGKPGGADFSDEKWERWMKINCKACNKEFDVEQNPALKELVTSILFKADANEQSNIKAWEQEIFPCEHTLTLEQWESKKIASKMMATCNNCNLSSNLWLCLTCGNLGCGRKIYGGTGGNSHAIAHFESTGHPLVVKTGTITPEGDASIYCYACNDDVKDAELAKHLQNFGIDLATQKKTDKTVTEMNLEFNLNFTLSKALEEGKVFTPVYGPGFTGIENLGNSCYINSVVQILFSLEAFQSQYLDFAIEHLNTCNEDTQNCFYCQVCKLLNGLYSGLYSAKKTRVLPKVDENSQEVIEEYQTGIKPSSFKHYFGKDHPEFSTNKQQDAFEYLSYLLEKFEKQEKALGRPNPRNIFEFDLENRLECTKCHGVKYKKQRTCFLNISIPKWEEKKEEGSICTFEETINKFLGEELVELNCSLCKQTTNWIKTQRVKNFPKYLIIIFERFVYDWIPLKLEVAFKPPVEKFN